MIEVLYKKLIKVRPAFTLAEVLLTLLIVGIVSSMVIPVLIQDTQNAELHTAWKKDFATMSQATQRIMTDNGGTMANLCSPDTNNNCFVDKYLPYLNYSKVCYVNFGSQDQVAFKGNCWHKLDGKSSHWLNGPGVIAFYFVYSDEAGLILNDGTLMVFRLNSASCKDSNTGCGTVIIDVNGFRSPNIVGKDIFLLYVFANKIRPSGYQGDTYMSNSSTCDSTKSSSSTPGKGFACSAQYLYN